MEVLESFTELDEFKSYELKREVEDYAKYIEKKIDVERIGEKVLFVTFSFSRMAKMSTAEDIIINLREIFDSYLSDHGYFTNVTFINR